MSFHYPRGRRDKNVKDLYHGEQVDDPYRWLENPDSDETRAFVDAQNAVSHPYFEGYAFRHHIEKKVTTLWRYEKVSTPYRHGPRYYQFRNHGLQNQSVIYTSTDIDSLEKEEQVFFDPNVLSEDGTIALSGTKFSEDGKIFAYGLSESGSDWLCIKFINVATGGHYKEVLNKVKFTCMTWTHDSKGFFYCAYLDKEGKADGSETDSNENQKLYYHLLETDQSEDVVAVEFNDPQLRIGANVSHCGNYLVITPIKGCKSNLLYFARLGASESITSKLPLEAVVTEFESDYEYITNMGSKFIFRTNKDAPNYRLIIIDFDNLKEDWKDLVSEHSKDVLEWAKPVNNDQLVMCYLKDVKNAMSLHKLETGEKIYDFPLDLGAVSLFSGKYNHSEMFYGFSSFLTPNIIYRVDLTEAEITPKVFYETKVGQFDPSKYESTQVFYESKDETRVPMFIVKKKGLKLDGSHPCLLYGYGGFNVNLTPSFNVSRVAFMESFGGIFALANIRGGGEYGDKWHNGGRYENKQNCFDDFQCAAEYLVKSKHTNVKKLAIQGGSNGGLLVAACLNQAPHLFGSAICQVGVLDMLRYHKFTIGYAWKSDYGCSDIPEQFNYLYKYSPLHNIRVPEGGTYPAVLLLTADHDDRVVPLHSLKFIAELQHQIGSLPQQSDPLIIRVETKAGHGAGKPTTKLIEEVVDIMCFLGRSLNLVYEFPYEVDQP